MEQFTFFSMVVFGVIGAGLLIDGDVKDGLILIACCVGIVVTGFA